MGVFGDTFRQARAEKGVTLKEAEQATRINRHHLSALEDENFAVLPALIYQRGIVRNYAAYLGLDPGKALAMFEEARGGAATPDLVAAVKPLDMPTHWAPNFAIIAFMVVMSAIVFAWIYSISFNQPAVTPTMPPAIPTVTPIPEDRLALPSPTPPQVAAQQPIIIPPANGQTSVAVPPLTVQPLMPSPAAQVIGVPTAAPIPSPTATPAPTVAPPPPPTRPAASGPTATIRVLAQGDIQVTVVADGATLFSGWLGAGGQTDWFTANQFQVTTTDGSLTLFENMATGQQFYMGYGPNETYGLGA